MNERSLEKGNYLGCVCWQTWFGGAPYHEQGMRSLQDGSLFF